MTIMETFNMEHAEHVVEAYLLDDAKRMGVASGYELREIRGGMSEEEAAELAPLSGEWAGALTPRTLTEELLTSAEVDAAAAPMDWLSMVEADLADQYEEGHYEGAAGHAKPCVKTWMNGICVEPGAYCDCDIVAVC